MAIIKRIFIDLLALSILVLLIHGGVYLYESYQERLNDSLVRACIGGDAQAVRKLLDKGADANARVRHFFPGREDTVLMAACYPAHPEIVRLLLSSGADPNLANADNFTPLMVAQQGGNIDVVRQLLDAGAYVDDVDDMRCSALEVACQLQRVEAAHLLLKNGADPNVDPRRSFRSAPLIYACRYGLKSLVRELLERGADVYVTDGIGETPLSWATRMGHEDIADMLREWQANHPKPPPPF